MINAALILGSKFVILPRLAFRRESSIARRKASITIRSEQISLSDYSLRIGKSPKPQRWL